MLSSAFILIFCTFLQKNTVLRFLNKKFKTKSAVLFLMKSTAETVFDFCFKAYYSVISSFF